MALLARCGATTRALALPAAARFYAAGSKVSRRGGEARALPCPFRPREREGGRGIFLEKCPGLGESPPPAGMRRPSPGVGRGLPPPAPSRSGGAGEGGGGPAKPFSPEESPPRKAPPPPSIAGWGRSPFGAGVRQLRLFLRAKAAPAGASSLLPGVGGALAPPGQARGVVGPGACI